MNAEDSNGYLKGNLVGFDASQIEPAVGFEPVPRGQYAAIITESEMKQTKAGNGEYLELCFQVIEGEFKGRRLWARLNLDNPNAVAVEIAKRELSAICRAVGVMEPKDSSELHDRPLLITVTCKPRKDNGEMANEIKGYAASSSASAPAQSPSAKSPPPWARPGTDRRPGR